MKKKTVILLCVIVVLAGLWFWRYTSMNAFYESISLMEERDYQAGEFVPFEDDIIFDKEQANGYYIRVDSMEIVDFDELCRRNQLSSADVPGAPDRVALVTITLFNEDNEEDPVTLLSFGMHGLDSSAGMNWDLLMMLNPVLEGHFSVRVEKGSQYQFVLPYNLRQRNFSSSTWNDMENYEWFLRVTTWPTEKDIAING